MIKHKPYTPEYKLSAVHLTQTQGVSKSNEEPSVAILVAQEHGAVALGERGLGDLLAVLWNLGNWIGYQAHVDFL